MTGGAAMAHALPAAIPFTLVLSVEFGPPVLAEPILAADAPWLGALARALARTREQGHGRGTIIVRITLSAPGRAAASGLPPAGPGDPVVAGVMAAFAAAGWASAPADVSIRERAYDGATPRLEVAVYAAPGPG
jgi:hypothetical protein